MYKQIIIARKDLQMSPGKLAAQVSHASISFLTLMIQESAVKTDNCYTSTIKIDQDLYEQWILGAFTKCVLQAKNKNDLLKAVKRAEEIGLQKNKDFFLIYDNCYTELQPEEENGTTLTCIGFKPMDSSVIDRVGKKYQLYR